MNWKAVVKSLREQGDDAVDKAEKLRAIQPSSFAAAGPAGGYNEQLVSDRWKTIERHRINGNFCFALADALEAGLK